MKIKCPLCEIELEYIFIKKRKYLDHDTHIWKCDECPFIGFEYWHNNNLQDLIKSIK